MSSSQDQETRLRFKFSPADSSSSIQDDNTRFDERELQVHVLRIPIRQSYFVWLALLVDIVLVATVFAEDYAALLQASDYYAACWLLLVAPSVLVAMQLLEWLLQYTRDPRVAGPRLRAQRQAAAITIQAWSVTFLIVGGILYLLTSQYGYNLADDGRLQFHFLAAGIVSLAVGVPLGIQGLYRVLFVRA